MPYEEPESVLIHCGAQIQPMTHVTILIATGSSFRHCGLPSPSVANSMLYARSTDANNMNIIDCAKYLPGHILRPGLGLSTSTIRRREIVTFDQSQT